MCRGSEQVAGVAFSCMRRIAPTSSAIAAISIKNRPMPLSSGLVLWIRNASIMIVAWKPSTRWIWFQVSPSTVSGSLTLGANVDERDLHGHDDAEQRGDRRDQEVVRCSTRCTTSTVRRRDAADVIDGIEILLNARNDAISITAPGDEDHDVRGRELELVHLSLPSADRAGVALPLHHHGSDRERDAAQISSHMPICLSPCR